MVEPMEPRPDPDEMSREPSLADQIASARLDGVPEPPGSPELEADVAAAAADFAQLASRIATVPPVDELARRGALRSVLAVLDDDRAHADQDGSASPPNPVIDPSRTKRRTAWLPRIAAAATVLIFGIGGFVLVQSPSSDQLKSSSSNETAGRAESDSAATPQSSDSGTAADGATGTGAADSGQVVAPEGPGPPPGGPSPPDPSTGSPVIDLGGFDTVDELRGAAVLIAVNPTENLARTYVNLGTCDVAKLAGSPPTATALLAGRRVVTTPSPPDGAGSVAIVDLEACRLVT